MASTYEIMTEKIVKMVEESGMLPWQRPWNVTDRVPANLERPDKPYRGINFWVLLMHGYTSPFWATYNQVKRLGGHVKKGEKGTMVVFWKIKTKEDRDTGDIKKTPILRYYYVFNLEQTTGIPEEKIPAVTETPKLDFEPIEACEKILKDMPIPMKIVNHGFDRATYSPYLDKITMPNKEDFKSVEEYYSTLFHELSHATGHETRCNRKDAFGSYFGKEKYSKEELVAEMSSCFLCNTAGIENKVIDNSAAYIKGWLSKLKNDPRMLIFAASAAEKAADYILDR